LSAIARGWRGRKKRNENENENKTNKMDGVWPAGLFTTRVGSKAEQSRALGRRETVALLWSSRPLGED